MPYASHERLCTEPFDGAVPITQEEYKMALAAIADGRRVEVADGRLCFGCREERVVYSVLDGQQQCFEVWPEEPLPPLTTRLPRPSDQHFWNYESEAWELS